MSNICRSRVWIKTDKKQELADRFKENRQCMFSDVIPDADRGRITYMGEDKYGRVEFDVESKNNPQFLPLVKLCNDTIGDGYELTYYAEEPNELIFLSNDDYFLGHICLIGEIPEMLEMGDFINKYNYADDDTLREALKKELGFDLPLEDLMEQLENLVILAGGYIEHYYIEYEPAETFI